ncbi:hypothetical protein CEXT_88641 [Caerostris extrusa]|uniref:Uncharacterized protein n=1 Tax=Caerostris extrusa TaxID=172846 RepID=A0AAV4X720_CAEEX|nr:hypothetical protein CEXT_88641 [Caerostris extrusa]
MICPLATPVGGSMPAMICVKTFTIIGKSSSLRARVFRGNNIIWPKEALSRRETRISHQIVTTSMAPRHTRGCLNPAPS